MKAEDTKRKAVDFHLLFVMPWTSTLLLLKVAFDHPGEVGG